MSTCLLARWHWAERGQRIANRSKKTRRRDQGGFPPGRMCRRFISGLTFSGSVCSVPSAAQSFEALWPTFYVCASSTSWCWRGKWPTRKLLPPVSPGLCTTNRASATRRTLPNLLNCEDFGVTVHGYGFNQERGHFYGIGLLQRLPGFGAIVRLGCLPIPWPRVARRRCRRNGCRRANVQKAADTVSRSPGPCGDCKKGRFWCGQGTDLFFGEGERGNVIVSVRKRIGRLVKVS